VCALLAGGVWLLRARVRRPAAAMLGAPDCCFKSLLVLGPLATPSHTRSYCTDSRALDRNKQKMTPSRELSQLSKTLLVDCDFHISPLVSIILHTYITNSPFWAIVVSTCVGRSYY
jgi:hypothetical protein